MSLMARSGLPIDFTGLEESLRSSKTADERNEKALLLTRGEMRSHLTTEQ